MSTVEEEIWKPIDGFDGYEVSNFGNVRCWNSRNGRGPKVKEPRMMTLSKFVGKNYYRVGMTANDGKTKHRRVHQLVLEAFVGPRPSPTHLVMHLDDNGLNNRLDNLKWGTPRENIEDMVRKNRQAKGERIARSGITEEQAKAIKDELAKDTGHGNMRRIAAKLGVTYRTVTEIKYGNSWGHV